VGGQYFGSFINFGCLIGALLGGKFTDGPGPPVADKRPQRFP
jgi:hypothetical protein